MEVRQELEFGEAFQHLLATHLRLAAENSPPGSVHALNLEALRQDHITMWTAWEGEVLLGCGALKELSPRQGEIKSMHTNQLHRQKGVAAKILKIILVEATCRNYQTLWLETGSTEDFAPAHLLYKKFGFQDCAPFAEYKEDPFSLFMTLGL